MRRGTAATLRAPILVEVSFGARRPWVPRAAHFVTWAAAALRSVPAPGLGVRRRGPSGPVRVSVRVVGAARARRLNARYRQRDKPTNVLSFGGAGALPDGSVDLGELVICAPVVAREARAGGKSREAHWAHLTVHGMLHLLGFDHEASAEAREMAAREVQLLGFLGFSDPYA